MIKLELSDEEFEIIRSAVARKRWLVDYQIRLNLATKRDRESFEMLKALAKRLNKVDVEV